MARRLTRTIPLLSRRDRARFDAKIVKTEYCWEWTGARSTFGHGQFRLAGALYGAHRIAWQEHHRLLIPTGLLVRHEVCDNPGCVYGGHLCIGTSADNNADQYRHGRAPIGERHGCAKLTDDQVLECRDEYRKLGTPVRQLAATYGVTDMTMRDVLLGKSWRHITGGVPVSPPRMPRLTAQERHTIIELRESGNTLKQIVGQTGRSMTAVTKTLYHAGLNQPRVGRPATRIERK